MAHHDKTLLHKNVVKFFIFDALDLNFKRFLSHHQASLSIFPNICTKSFWLPTIPIIIKCNFFTGFQFVNSYVTIHRCKLGKLPFDVINEITYCSDFYFVLIFILSLCSNVTDPNITYTFFIRVHRGKKNQEHMLRAF